MNKVTNILVLAFLLCCNNTFSQKKAARNFIHYDTVNCVKCNGQGYTNCNTCINSRATCFTCKGYGDLQCSTCRGRGFDAKGISCNFCKGIGTIMCSTCGRKGDALCSRCNGTQKLTCPACNGKKRRIIKSKKSS